MSATASQPSSAKIIWSPQPGPQEVFCNCPFPEVLFGGARGGGKSDGILGKYGLKAQRYGRDFNAVFFRREMPQSDDLIERAKELYLPLGAVWKDQPKTFQMPTGGRIRFRPLENTTDAQKYQGQNLSDAAVEEAGNYETPAPIDMLHGALRSKAGVPTQLLLTANPGGPGQAWLKHRYIDPWPTGNRLLTRKLPNGAIHRYIYIPSRVQDNLVLMRNDPAYINRLYLVGSEALVRAWLEGDWSVVAGAFYPEFSMDKHVIEPTELPLYWHRFRSFDWGSARPFCCLWWAVSDGELPRFPRGALICYREWYGAPVDDNGHTIPNAGLRLTAEEIGDGIFDREKNDLTGNRQMGGVADPSIFTADGGPSHADRMAARKVYFREADNSRVAKLGAVGGWDQLRARLRGDGEKPAIYWFSTCVDSIRTLPMLQHDVDRPEDVDTDGEDHACFVAGTIVNGSPVDTIGYLTRSDTRTVILRFADGFGVECTPDHRFLTESGEWVRADQMLNQSALSALPHRNSWASAITSAAFTFSARAVDCIAQCGSIITDRCHAAGMFITSMMIEVTTSLRTWSLCSAQTMSPITAESGLLHRQVPSRWPLQPNGTVVTKGAHGTESKARKPLPSKLPAWLLWCAKAAGNLSRRRLTSLIARASATSTAKCERCVAVEPQSEPRDVYCLQTTDGWLRLANGTIASNCDAIRYACMSRPYSAPLPPEMEPPRDRYVKKRKLGRFWQNSGWAA